MSLTTSDAQVSEAPEAPPPPPVSTSEQQLTFKRVLVGDPFPWMIQACGTKERFGFDTLAGRYQLYCFFGDGADTEAKLVLQTVMRRRALFDDAHCSFFGVSVSAVDRQNPALCNQEPGLRFAWDLNQEMARACGVAALNAEKAASLFRRQWILVDPSLHVLAVFPFTAASTDQILDYVARLPEPDRFGGVARPAPILLLPNVFDRSLCARLIAAYNEQGGEESGVHRDGRGVHDYGFKRRKDLALNDSAMVQETNAAIFRRVVPEIEKLFFMKARYIERHIVGCYAAEDGATSPPIAIIVQEPQRIDDLPSPST